MATYITLAQQAGSQLLEANRRQTIANRQGLAKQEKARQVATQQQEQPPPVPVSGSRRVMVPGDELAAFRKPGGPLLLLHMDGVNGSTAFIDSGSLRLPVTASGLVSIATDQAKFGQSAKFTGQPIGGGDPGYEGGFLSVASARLALGESDFTIELWIYANSDRLSTFDQPILAFPNLSMGGIWAQTYADGVSLGWSVGAPGDNVYAEVDNYLSYDQWHHFAVVRIAGIVSLFVDGILQTGSYATIAQPALPVDAILIGGWLIDPPVEVGGVYFRGWLDELRIIKGKAVYISNFTPPATPFR